MYSFCECQTDMQSKIIFSKTNNAKSLLAFVVLMLSSSCQENSREKTQIAINTLACQYMHEERSIKVDEKNPVYAPQFTIDVTSGQEVRVEEDLLNSKTSAQRFIGDASGGAFRITSSAITKNKFESVSTFFDPHNSKSVFVSVTRIYLKNMMGFTSRMRFSHYNNNSKIYNTEIPPRKIKCKWEYPKNKFIPASKYSVSPLEGGTPSGGILMSNGWYEIDSKNQPKDSYED